MTVKDSEFVVSKDNVAMHDVSAPNVAELTRTVGLGPPGLELYRRRCDRGAAREWSESTVTGEFQALVKPWSLDLRSDAQVIEKGLEWVEGSTLICAS